MTSANPSSYDRAAKTLRALLLGGAFALVAGNPVAWANPQGGSVVAGNVTIGGAGKTLTINQTTNRAIVNWQSFSVGTGETTRIVLPSSLSAILNRVTGSGPSAIAGQISSNGQVYLINPNGIVVGPNGRIDTGAFVASTLNIPNAAFMQGGGMTFMGDSGAGIRVLGKITAANGDVVLVAAVVDHQGRIAAPNGQAILGAGGQFYYMPDGTSDIVIAARPGSGPASVSNSGAIAAANVQLRTAGSAYALAVNNSGLVSATAVRQVGGRVVLDGGAGDTVVSGTIAAQSGPKGGTVTIAGQRVTLTGSALVDASGSAGGGTVKVGGKNNTTTVAAGARIAVNATGAGNGGAVEFSGNALAFQGSVDLSAPYGTVGSLLLDPVTISICNTCGTTPSAIAAALLSGNTTVQATASMTVDSPITSAAPNRLVLDAPNIAVNSNISLPNGLLTFTNTLQPSGGTLSSASSATITVSQIDIAGAYNVTNLAGRVVTPVLNVNQQGFTGTSFTANNAANNIASLTFSLQGDSFSGNVAVSSSAAMGFVGAVTTTGAISLTAGGDLTIQSGTVLTASGTTTLAATGGTFANNAGAGLIAGTGRTRIYTATDVGFSDGGLGYTQFNPVVLGNDPMSGLSDVTYIANAILLPTLTVEANSVARPYGGPNPSFSVGLSGGTAGDLATQVQFAIGNGPATNVGTYAIVPSGAISSTRALRFVNGTLTVDPAVLNLVVNDTSRLAGTANPVFTVKVSGLVNGDLPTVVSNVQFNTAAGIASLAGLYPVTASRGPVANYTLNFTAGALTVAPAPTPVTAPTTVAGVNIALITQPVGGPTTPLSLTPVNFTPTAPQTFAPQAPIIVCGIGCLGFGNGPQQAEFNSIIQKFVAGLAGTTTPPVTADDIYKALADPTRSAQMMALLMPLVIADLTAILKLPGAQWTAQQKGFVQAVQNYIQVQREAAANQALADYQAWATQQSADRTALLAGQPPLSVVAVTASIASNMPTPPTDILKEAQLGITMNAGQLTSFAALKSGAGVAGAVGGTAGIASTVMAILGVGGTGTSELLAVAPGAATVLPNARPATVASDTTLSRLTQNVSVAQKSANQAIQDAKVASNVTTAAAANADAAKAAAAAAQNALTVLEGSPAVGDAFKAIMQANNAKALAQTAAQNLQEALKAQPDAVAKALTTSRDWAAKAAKLDKATAELKALQTSSEQAIAKSAASAEAIPKLSTSFADLTVQADKASRAASDAHAAWKAAVAAKGPLSQEAKAANKAWDAALEVSKNVIKAQYEARSALELAQAEAPQLAKAAESAKAAKAVKASEVATLTSDVAKAQQEARAADAMAKAVADLPRLEEAATKAASVAQEAAKAAEAAKVIADNNQTSIRAARAVSEQAAAAARKAEGVAADAAKASAEALKGVSVADDTVKAAAKAAKVAGVADEALSAVGVANDVLKGVKVGLTGVEMATIGIPVVGEVVAVIGDVIQIGMSVGAIASAAIFNQNLANTVATAQKPVTVADLVAMTQTATGQQQMTAYLTAMASTNGQPPTVTQPSMTLKQIVALSNSF